MKTKHYSKEFRLQAARLVVEQGYSYAEVAQRLRLKIGKDESV